MRPTIRQLEYVIAVAEEASFSKAAARCHVAQPSLSVQIRKLELRLGVTLFERTRNGALVTTAGERVVGLGRRILEASDLITESARSSADPLTGPLHLGSVSTITPYVLPGAMVDLHSQFPHHR